MEDAHDIVRDATQGKYMLIQFGPRGDIAGGKINKYLLEKTRIVQQGSVIFSFSLSHRMTVCLPVSPAYAHIDA